LTRTGKRLSSPKRRKPFIDNNIRAYPAIKSPFGHRFLCDTKPVLAKSTQLDPLKYPKDQNNYYNRRNRYNLSHRYDRNH